MDKEFPIYRKSSNNRNWYKILDERHFVEIQKVGERYFSFEVKAKQYPEMLRIQDMLNCASGFEHIDKGTFEALNSNQSNSS